MRIEFRLFDKTTSTFRVVYFMKWNQNVPYFTSNSLLAKKYWHELAAAKDIQLLKKAESKIAITISIKVVF